MNTNLELLDRSDTSLRIKFTIPFSSYNDAVYAKDTIEEAIGMMEKDITLNDMTFVVQVKDSHEFFVEIEPPKSQEDLLHLIKLFYNRLLDNRQIPSHEMPIIFVSSPLFFDNSCTPIHADVSLQSLYFGNIINSGAMAVHWAVEFYEPKQDKSDNNARDRVQDKMKVHFEHDRGSILIKYESNDVRHIKYAATQQAGYTIKFPYEAIRRIIVDLTTTPKSRNHACRIHFDLNCPPQVLSFIRKKDDESNNKRAIENRIIHLSRGTGEDGKWSERPHWQCVPESSVVTLEFNQMTKPELFQILSRLRMRSKVPIEFASMDLINMYWGQYHQLCPYVADPLGPAFIERIQWASIDQPAEFRLRYMIEALLSRGAKVKDQLLVSPTIWTNFIDIVCKLYKKDAKKTLIILEKLLNRIDNMSSFPVESIFNMLIEEIKEYERLKTLNDAQMGNEARESLMERDGYLSVRKLVITPTRKIFLAPEQIMENRILRKYYENKTEILRVSFRDDDNQPLRSKDTGESFTKTVVERALEDGITVGGQNFRYLGSSNSQLRDHGGYFVYEKEETYKMVDNKKTWTTSETVKKIRKDMGRLEELENAAKYMARMGLCFTQSRSVNVGIPLHTSDYIYEISGGNSLENVGEIYTFSDGVGQISVEHMKKIAKDLKLPNYPCVIQFRHRGYKGVLTLNPQIDRVNELREKLEIYVEVNVKSKKTGETKKEMILEQRNIRFRQSQKKFHAQPSRELEVVKIGGPTPVCLNKQLINILDQVSEIQSDDCHSRMCDRVEELLHRMLRMMSDTLVNEKSCRDKLKELPRRVSIDALARSYGFTLCTEPYFRSLIKAAIRCMIKKQLNKEQIQIPLDMGRSMFGVVDDTGLLQYGQIFVQYHVNLNNKTPGPSASKIIHTGKTMITKNPCISAGDVRMFDAVDIPALRHLVDVIVFPQHGPRPHPDEMAGSDLDGDEYSVIWDPKLFFERNETAMKFPKATSKPEKLNMDILDKQIRGFFTTYLTQDSVGMIANAHLNISDLYGIESTVAKQLAGKHSYSVDFPKTMVPPAPLTTDWVTVQKDLNNPESQELIPPERANMKPDFMQSNRDPVYASNRLAGRIYREIQDVDNVVALSEEKDQQVEVTIDEMIDVEGWENYEAQAFKQMTVYNNEIKALMERYGIATEGELMSGCMISIKNTLSDKDDMSFFSTNQVIETQVTEIVRSHRENFFKEFGEIKKLTKVAEDRMNVSDETDNIFERQVISPTDAMRQKAVALYKVTYNHASDQNDSSPRLLSYPWVAYDVLAEVRNANLTEQQKKGETPFIAGLEPVHEKLREQVRNYASENDEEFRAAVSYWTDEDGEEAIKTYLNYYDGLAEIAYFIIKWTHHEKVQVGRISEIHIIAILIQFCIGSYDELDTVFMPIELGTQPEQPRVAIVEEGNFVLNFFRFLSSRTFKNLRRLVFTKVNMRRFVNVFDVVRDIRDLNIQGCFIRREWIPLHLAAVKTFYDLIFSLRIDLPVDGDELLDPPSIITEMTPFVVQLPKNASLPECERKIRCLTGATEVRMRRLPTREQTRVSVSAVGTLLSHTKIRELLIIPLDVRKCSDPRKMSDDFPTFLLARLG